MYRGVEETFQSKQTKMMEDKRKAEESEQGRTFLILCGKRCLLRFHPGAVEQARGFQKDFRTRVERIYAGTEKTRLRGKKKRNLLQFDLT
jgi:hypothetical protein